MKKTSEVALIIAGGAAGGLLSVLDAWADPVSYPLTLSKLASLLLIPAIKGGAAAGIGVYLLTTFDPTQTVRGFFFAVTCGLAFPSILANGTSYAQKVTSQVAAKSIVENAERLKGTTTIAEIQDASIAIAKAAAKVEPGDAQVADAAVQQAVANLSKAADAANAAATVDAISAIGTAAAAQRLPATTNSARIELKVLQGNAQLPVATKERAASALGKLEGSTR